MILLTHSTVETGRNLFLYSWFMLLATLGPLLEHLSHFTTHDHDHDLSVSALTFPQRVSKNRGKYRTFWQGAKKKLSRLVSRKILVASASVSDVSRGQRVKATATHTRCEHTLKMRARLRERSSSRRPSSVTCALSTVPTSYSPIATPNKLQPRLSFTPTP